MITIQERSTKKLPGQTSLFVSFSYNKIVVEELKMLSNVNYNPDTKEWELPLFCLSEFVDRVCKLDNIQILLLPDWYTEL